MDCVCIICKFNFTAARTFDMLKKKSMFHTLFIGKQKPTGRIFAFFGNRGAYFDN